MKKIDYNIISSYIYINPTQKNEVETFYNLCSEYNQSPKDSKDNGVVAILVSRNKKS